MVKRPTRFVEDRYYEFAGTTLDFPYLSTPIFPIVLISNRKNPLLRKGRS